MTQTKFCAAQVQLSGRRLWSWLHSAHRQFIGVFWVCEQTNRPVTSMHGFVEWEWMFEYLWSCLCFPCLNLTFWDILNGFSKLKESVPLSMFRFDVMSASWCWRRVLGRRADWNTFFQEYPSKEQSSTAFFIIKWWDRCMTWNEAGTW